MSQSYSVDNNTHRSPPGRHDDDWMPGKKNLRILIVDDNPDIHQDFSKILTSEEPESDALADFEAEFFGTSSEASGPSFELDSAYQGQEALKKVTAARDSGQPYAVVFMDVRMPPGWDGVETTSHVLEADPDVGVVICSAYSDHQWEDFRTAFGSTDRVLILKKPFDTVEVRQLAHALQRRWELAQQASMKLEDLERRVQLRTSELVQANEQVKAEATARQKMEVELRLAQKLESIAHLAAGLAHEINTPLQFIGDNLHFIGTSFEDLNGLIGVYKETQKVIDQLGAQAGLMSKLKDAEEEVDLEYLDEHVPKALKNTIQGVERVTRIIDSLKHFSQRGDGSKRPINLNTAIADTLAIATGEHRHLANVETEFGELPMVKGYPGEVHQALLSVVLNAVQAIEGNECNGESGQISVRTFLDQDDFAVIAISDTGAGIPEEIRDQIYDPFFTTKGVGGGTGQGLTIARSVIVEKHHGKIDFTTQPGLGTTFFIRLPTHEPGDKSCGLVA